jgi:hypothetical protein
VAKSSQAATSPDVSSESKYRANRREATAAKHPGWFSADNASLAGSQVARAEKSFAAAKKVF